MNHTRANASLAARPGASPLREIAPATLNEWLTRGKAIVVDVRDADEHAREWIAGSTLLPFSRLTPQDLPREPGKVTVLICRSGRRSRDAARRLLSAGETEACQLEGGLAAWTAAGFHVEKDVDAPSPVMRQVQLTVGGAVLLFSLLAATISPWFLLLCGAMGAGLLFAGATSSCALASLLERMPWNRV